MTEITDKKTRIFGIDLGTTYSAIAYVDDYGKPVIVPNSDNDRVTPSVIFFDKESNNIIVGKIAKENAKIYPDDVVSFVKRSMGDSNFIFEHEGKQIRAEEISSYIIKKVVQDAEKNLDVKINDIIITCPAYFGINEREATRRAGEIAGYRVRQIVNEPTAAAISYGLKDETTKDKVILVYDLGGGTFDVTMISIKSDSIEVICTDGDHNLGGKDWDDRIVQYFVQEFQQKTQTNEDILDDSETCQTLQIEAEKAKQTLSQRASVSVSVVHGGKKAKIVLEKSKFDEITQDLLERTVLLTNKMLNEAKAKDYTSFDEIILVGGSTRMPQVCARIEKEFSVKPKIFDPDEAVAKGAAIFGWKIAIKEGVIKMAAEKTGRKIETIEDVEEDDDLLSNLDAIEEIFAEDTGYKLSDVKRSRMKIKNVASKSFGVVAHNKNDQEIVFNLIKKNTDVPIFISKSFGTAVFNQKEVSITIMENDSTDHTSEPDQSVEIGTAILQLPPNLKPNTPVDITFKLNEEGRLETTAMEPISKRRVNVVIETKAVIQGEDFERAKKRNRSLVIT